MLEFGVNDVNTGILNAWQGRIDGIPWIVIRRTLGPSTNLVLAEYLVA
jgi:hypothetical protein